MDSAAEDLPIESENYPKDDLTEDDLPF